jgi:hypothetical protein
MSFGRMFFIKILPALAVFCAIVVSFPHQTADPAAKPDDPAKEDLTRFVYPSQARIPWAPHFMRPKDNLERLFGNDWVYVARFNRLDRRHAYPGMSIKVPLRMEDIKQYTPLPAYYEPAARYRKYILIQVTEQWIGAYEYGQLKFSMPAATGRAEAPTPLGMFRIDAFDQHHTSSLYKTEKGQAQYPMDWAMRFHVDEKDVGFWIHARDLPGRPASHGCVGLFDEAMQRRTYTVPEHPVLMDAKKLYEWAVSNSENDANNFDSEEQEPIVEGPVVEITGNLPNYLPAPPTAQ